MPSHPFKPEFGNTAADYSRHRAGFPPSIFDRLAAFGVGLAGQRLIDLGTGTGAFARGFARRGCTVVGIDPETRLLDQARRLDAEEGLSIEYRIGRAEETGLEDDAADVVSAGQCWHWFDRFAAAREVARILRPEGRLVIAHFDWIPLPDTVVEATEDLIAAHNPRWKFAKGTGLYPRWLRDLGKASFRDIETFSYDVPVDYSPEDWRGRIRASAGVGATLGPEQVAAFDRALAEVMARRFPAAVHTIPHRVFAVIARAPARAAR
jgi:SAM-dependent methyltransferase